jgi:Spy/CpxP family protein refolding chaperone
MRFLHVHPTQRRAPLSTLLRGIALVLLAAGLALTPGLAAQARPGGGPHGPGGPGDPSGPGRWIERHAEALDLDEATLAKIEAVVGASREEAERIRAEHHAAREAMRALLDQDAPDRAAVMRQAEALGAIDTRRHKQRLATMLDIRALLTPEQRTKLRGLKDDMRERRRGHGHHPDCPGDCDGRCHGRHHGMGKRGDIDADDAPTDM